MKSQKQETAVGSCKTVSLREVNNMNPKWINVFMLGVIGGFILNFTTARAEEGRIPSPKAPVSGTYEAADPNYNDGLFKTVNGQSMRVNGQKTLFFNGDSIASGYASVLKENLTGKVNALYRKDLRALVPSVKQGRKDIECTAEGILKFLKTCLDTKEFNVDFVMLNAGIHDSIKEVPVEDYKKNLQSVIDLAQQHKIKMIWVTSTPITDQIKKHPNYTDQIKRLDVLNAGALEVMSKNHIPVIDLHSFMVKLIESDGLENVYRDAYHQKPEYSAKQARFIADELMNILGDEQALRNPAAGAKAMKNDVPVNVGMKDAPKGKKKGADHADPLI